MVIKDKRNSYICICNKNGLMSCLYHVTLSTTGKTPDENMDPLIDRLTKEMLDSLKK